MRTLFLDFASHHKSIALIEDDRTLVLEAIDDHTNEAELLPRIEKLITNNSAAVQAASRAGKPALWSTIDRILAVTGPGGFMSLRVGISLANALADQLKILIAGVHLSEVWGMCAEVSSPILWLHSTKKDLVFVRGFGGAEALWKDPICLSVEELKKGLTKNKIFDGNSVPFVGEVIEEQRKILPMLKPIGDLRPLEDILPEIAHTAAYGRESLVPWYGRHG